MKNPCVYILASSKNGSLYIGVTSDLPSRMTDHQTGQGSKHAAKYQIHRLVWFESHDDMDSAIQREKSLKRYKRQWKINLIEENNPEWLPLHPETGEFLPFEWD